MSPHRRILITVLIYCEGLHDQVFIRHIMQLYRIPSSEYYFDIKHGDGGSPKSLVEKAHKMPGDYRERIVVFDNDRGIDDLDAAKKATKGKSVSISCFSPSLECTMLSILEPKKDFSAMSTDDLKKYLHSTYIKSDKRGSIASYSLFTKEKLNEARKRILELDEKIRYLER